MDRRKEASQYTKDFNEAVYDQLDFDNEKDFEDIKRGFIAPLPNGGVIKNADGEIIWDVSRFAYVEGDRPDSVNPSLWRQTALVKHAGLFKVVDRIYQVRSHDLGNVTIIEGDDGLIIMDCGTMSETAKFALGENVIAGNVMARRTGMAFGGELPHCAQGMISVGIGLDQNGPGTNTYISPTDIVRETGEERKISGLTFIFQMAPDTEAPEEFHFYIPELKALTCAENANHSLHNIQTLRGARTRDALNFAKYLDEALELFGEEAEVHFGPHTWPVWGNDELTYFLRSQRDAYKYIHDQTLRLANHGLTPIEIAEVLTLPEQLARDWWNRGYHGTLNHDVEAVFAKELGWFDGNPANLYPLPPAESAKRYVDLIGGADAVIAAGRKTMELGDYRWVAELAGKAVFAEPGNQEARVLQADAFEQLGYQAEGPQWRNTFLTAAQELRDGTPTEGVVAAAGADMIAAMPLDLLLDFVAVRLNGPKAAPHEITINLSISDVDEPHSIQIRNGVLHHWNRLSKNHDATLSLPRLALVGILFKPESLEPLIDEGKVEVEGDLESLRTLLGLLDDFSPYFDLLGPNELPE